MTLPTFPVGDLHTILPELFICASAFTLLMADLFIDAKRRALIHFLAIAVLAWFIAWWGFVIATVVIMIALANRQFHSRARTVAQQAADALVGRV